MFIAAPSTSNASTDAIVFQKIVNTISKETIPSGYFKNFTPGLSPEIRLLTDRRDAIRATDPNDPEISQLNHQITSLIKEEATKTWRVKLSKSSHKSNLTHFWSLMRSLPQSTDQIQNQNLHETGNNSQQFQ